MQVATARDAVLGQLGSGPALAATLRSWTRTLLLLTVGADGRVGRLRAPIASAVGVHQQWAAAIGLPAGVLWLLLSLLRGALQGTRRLPRGRHQPRRRAGRAARARRGRSQPPASTSPAPSSARRCRSLAMAGYCAVELRRRTARKPAFALRRPQADRRGRRRSPPAARPRRRRGRADRRARDRRAAAEHRHHRRQAPLLDRRRQLVQRDRGRGEGARLGRDGRRLLPRAGDLAPPLPRARTRARCCCARSRSSLRLRGAGARRSSRFGGRLLLRLAFGADRLLAVDALLPLGVAFTLLALTYLAIQYLLALAPHAASCCRSRRSRSPSRCCCSTVAPTSPDGFAAVVLAIQALAAVVALGLAFARRERRQKRRPIWSGLGSGGARRSPRPPGLRRLGRLAGQLRRSARSPPAGGGGAAAPAAPAAARSRRAASPASSGV